MKVAVLVLVVATVGAGLVAATDAAARTACTPGRSTAGRTFCGPARATLKIGGKRYVFKQGGNCTKSGSVWNLRIGTITLVGKAKRTFFGILSFGSKAGKHSAAVSWQFPGKKSTSLKNATVTLARGLKKGTFTGSNPGGGKATGTFSCR